MREWIKKFQDANLLKVIDKFVDVELEVAHISYIEAKKPNPKILLFTNVIDIKNNHRYPYPLITNLFANYEALSLILGDDPDNIANNISSLMNPKKPDSIMDKFDIFKNLLELKEIFPQKTNKNFAQSVVIRDDIDLFKLPILKTWEGDGGRFITMGQVYLKDGDTQNLGMYRLQVIDKDKLLIHFQIHKDGASIFRDYKKSNKKIPISIGIGGDPLYIWCAQAPMPPKIYELLLYGFIRKNHAKVIKSITNEIYIPHDLDFVIEGFIDPDELVDEGPFGDHTGFYTPIDKFPLMRVSAITHKKDAIFNACVVGKPPLEDKFMGLGTERIFLPLIKCINSDLIDYKMPENGCFHNLLLCKMNSSYPYASIKLMHTLLGSGQMSFIKNLIIADEDAPNPSNYEEFSRYVLNRISYKSFVFNHGISDELDHSSPKFHSSKVMIDATIKQNDQDEIEILSDDDLLKLFRLRVDNLISLKQYYTDTLNPIVLISVDKKERISDVFDRLLEFKEYFKILIFLPSQNDIKNLYMSIWRITNNTDPKRDIYIKDKRVCIDSSDKNMEFDGFNWPDEVKCTKSIINDLIDRDLIKYNKELFKKFEIDLY